MSEAVSLQTVDSAGVLTDVTLRLEQSSFTRIELIDQDNVFEVVGGDYIDCLLLIRQHLEAGNRLLCCQGARADVWPSGMLRQFSNGRRAYVLDREQDGEPMEVDVFGPADPATVVSLLVQRDAVLAFHRLSATNEPQKPWPPDMRQV